MKANQDFSELLACLMRHGVRALVVDLEVAYIGRKALIRNKAASGRTQDRADLELLQETQHDTPQRG